jgi:hypothetical protein
MGVDSVSEANSESVMKKPVSQDNDHAPAPKSDALGKPTVGPQGAAPLPKQRSGAAPQVQNDVSSAVNVLVPKTKTLVGDAGIDSEGMGACAAQGTAGCFLTVGQRQILVGDMQQRVTAAQGSYRDALNDCRLQQVLKKTDELPWYMSLMLGAIASGLESAIGVGIKALKASGAAESAIAAATSARTATAVDEGAHAVANSAIHEASNAGAEVATVSDKQLETLVASSLDKAKEKAAGALAGATSTDSKETAEKNAALNYIDFLRNESADVFQNLREDAPGTTTDAELLALWRSFDAALHTTDRYRNELNEKIEKYLSSSVSKIGRSSDWNNEPSALGPRQVEREVRVAWLVTKGAGKRLVYMDRTFDGWYLERQGNPITSRVTRSAAYDSGENQLSLSQDATWNVNGKDETRSEKPLQDDRVLSFVEPEFEKMAIAKQEKIWLESPATFAEDWDHQVAVGVPRIIKVHS